MPQRLDALVVAVEPAQGEAQDLLREDAVVMVARGELGQRQRLVPAAEAP